MNRYDIDSVLAEGAQGRVYRATDRITGQSCVLKTGETVRDEALLALELSHPYIAQPFDAGIDLSLGQYAAYPEYTEPSLLEWSRSSSPVELQRVALQIAEFLAFLHGRGWLYHDFKPEHFLVARQRIRVLDLGLAQPIQECSQTFSGTFPYIAPERLAGRKCDARSDIFALGMLLLHVLQPDEKWDFEPSIDVLQNLQKRTRKLTGFWKNLLSEMISLEPAQRIESAAELWKRLLPPDAQNSFLFFYIPPPLEIRLDFLGIKQFYSFQSASNLVVSDIERLALAESWKKGIFTAGFDFPLITPHEIVEKLCRISNCEQPGDLFAALANLKNTKQIEDIVLILRYPEKLPQSQQALLSFIIATLQNLPALRFVLIGNKHGVDLPDDGMLHVDVPGLTKKSLKYILTAGFTSEEQRKNRHEKILSKGYVRPEEVLADLRNQMGEKQFEYWPAAIRDLAPPKGIESLRPTEMRILESLAIAALPICTNWLFKALGLSKVRAQKWVESLQAKGLIQIDNDLVRLVIFPQPLLEHIRKNQLKHLADQLLQNAPNDTDQEMAYRLARVAGKKRLAALTALRLARLRKLDPDWYLKAILSGAQLPKTILYDVVRYCLRTGQIRKCKYILRSILLRFGPSLYLGLHWLDLHWRTTNYEVGRKLALKLAHIAERRSCIKYTYYFQIEYAAFLIQLHRHNQAEAILTRLQKPIGSCSEQKLKALLNNRLGILCFFKGQLVDAIRFGRQSVTCHHRYIGASFMNLGIYLCRYGQHQEAEKWFSKSVSFFQELNDSERLASVLSNFGILFKRKGDLRKARECYFQGLHLSRCYKNNTILLSSLNNISESYEIEGRVDLAFAVIKRAIRIGRRFKNKYLLGFSLKQAGGLKAIRGEFNKAILNLHEAINLFISISADGEVAATYEILGLTYFFSGHNDRAKFNLQNAFELYLRAGSDIDVFRTRLLLKLVKNQNVADEDFYYILPKDSFESGIYHFVLGRHLIQFSKADYFKIQSHLNEAERIFRKIPSLFWLGLTLKLKVELYVQTAHITKARTCFESTYDIFSRLGSSKELLALNRIHQVIDDTSVEIKSMTEGLPYKVLAMVREVLSANDSHSMITRILSESMDFTSMERAVLILSETPPRIFKSATLDDKTVLRICEISQTALEETAENQKPYQRLNTVSDKFLLAKPSIIANKIQSILCLPLRSEDKHVGILYLDSKEGVETVSQTESLVLEIFAKIISLVLKNALEFEGTKSQNEDINTKIERNMHWEILGQSPLIEVMRARIQKFSQTDHPTLITGETGTGKELVSHLLHSSSVRRDNPFIALNCASISESLVEAELFGYEKGAFTSANSTKAGLLEEASNGTLLFDEIADFPFSLQAKLLRVLQENEFRRLGGNKLIRTNARFVFASNKNLLELVRLGKFREDLFYRISGFKIEVPALRERKTDIAPLATLFLQSFQNGKKNRRGGFSKEAIQLMEEFSWPGNVRQLRNEIQRIVAFAEKRIIEPDDFSIEVSKPVRDGTCVNKQLTLRAIEQKIIENRLYECHWNIVRTAKSLGLTRHGLYNKMRMHNIHRMKPASMVENMHAHKESKHLRQLSEHRDILY